MMIRNSAILLLLMIASTAMAEPSSGATKDEKEWARKIVSDQRNEAVLADMVFLTAHEEKKFFGIYNMYRDEMKPILDKETKLITDYADAYVKNNLSDQQASIFVDIFLDLKSQRISLKRKYVNEFRKVMSPKHVARFIQIENKLDVIVNYEIGRHIPLVPVNK